MRIPRLVLLLAALSAAYLVSAPFLDRPAQDRPLENPYHLLLALERDATLRSAYFGEVARLRRTSPPQVHDFDTPSRLQQQVEAPASLGLAFEPASLVPHGGSFRVTRSAAAGGLRIRVPVPEPWADRPCVVEARFCGRSGTPDREGTLWVAVAASAESRAGPRLALAELPAAPVPEDSPARVPEGWQDWKIVTNTPRSGALSLDVHHDFAELLCDEIVLRPATRVEACLDGGNARSTGATEPTRELKRMVARGADERLCLVLESSSVLTYVFDLTGDPARLDLATSAACSASSVGRTELTVAIAREGEFEETLLRTALGPEDADRFQEHALDLSRYSRQRVRLQFRVTPLDGDDGPVLLLADPTLTVASRESATPHVVLLTYGSEESPGGTDPFARLRAEGLAVDVTGESSDALVNVFALLTGLGIPAGPRPCPSVPELPGDACSLAQAFLGRGYLTFAVVARARHGTLLQGFPQRANGLLEDPVAVGLRWLESHRTRPSFLWIELPVRESLGTFLRGLDTQHLDPALVVLAPERDGPLIFRLPGRAGRDPQCRAPVQTRDVGATLFQLLGQAPPSGLGGRPFSLEDLQRGSIPPAPACTFQWSDAGLPPLHTLCLTLPAAGSAMSLGGGR